MTMTETRPVEDATIALDGYQPGRLRSQKPLPDSPAPGQMAPAKPGDEGARPPGHESHARTIIKSLTWRAGGLVMTMGVAWWITGKGEVAASIGLADTLVKVVVFYLHERMWLKIPFGRARTPEYEI